MWARVSNIILKNRLLLLIIIGVITIFMVFKAKNIELSYAGSKVLPLSDSAYVEYNRFKEKFGEDGTMMVIGFDSEKLYDKEVLNDWKALSERIRKIQGISGTLCIANVFDLVKDTTTREFRIIPLLKDSLHSQAEADSFRTKLSELKFYQGLLYSEKSNATLMAITFDKKLLNSKQRGPIVKEIQKISTAFSAKHHIDLHYSGLPWIRSKVSDKVAKEFVLFLLLALGMTAIVLFFFFRSFTAVFFPMLVVINGVIWALGIMVLLGYQINLLSGMLPALIVIIGIPNSVLILNKYHNEFRKTGDKLQSLKSAIRRIGPTALLANVSAAIGFGVFAYTNSEILTQFGVVAPINIIATYVVTMITIPIIFSYLPAPSTRHIKHLENKFLQSFLGKIEYLILHYRTAIYIISAGVVTIAIIGAARLQSNGYVVDDLPANDPILQDLKFFESNFDGILPLEVTIDTKKKNGIMKPNCIRKVNELQNMITSYPEFSRPVSLLEVLKFTTQAFYGGNPQKYRCPSSVELAFIAPYASKMQDTGGKLLNNFMDKNKQETRISFQMADVGSAKMNKIFEEIRPKVDSIFPPDKYTVNITGSSVLFLKGNNYMIHNLRESLILAIILISLIIFALFRSYKINLIALIPNLISLIFTAGMMGYIGISLKPSTILIFSVAFGLANDQTIYYLTKYRQELSSGKLSISEAVKISLKETGVSMIYAAAILFFGFGIFAASSFRGTVWLGVLVSTTLLIALLSNLVLVPSLLLSLEQRNKRKAVTKPAIDMDMSMEQENGKKH